MCGIAGVFAVGGTLPFGGGVVESMCRQIVHRGPDDQGVYRDASAQIGMRRLSIIDVGGGHQPIHNEDESIQVVFNGEIYNFQELRRELEARGHRFYTHSDTECIVHAYEEYGDACFSHLRGMFAIAIVDKARQRLVLGRDRLGKKPLYYSLLPGGVLAFASELKCLFEVPGFSPRISHRATLDYFVLGYVPAPASIYEGVHKLLPAHSLTVERGQIRTQCYWQPQFEPKLQGDEATLKRQLLEQIEEAVRVRLVSDVPFGAFLSGGLDSSVVAALMARNLSQPVKTFSIGFEEERFNELPAARAVARHIGAEHHEFVVEADAVEAMRDLVWYFDEPFGDSSALPTHLVSKMAVGHVKMVLSGDGGDELFAGYERYRKYQTLLDLRSRSLGLAGVGLRALSAVLPGAAGVRLGRIGQRIVQDFPDDYLSGVAICNRDDLALVLKPELAQLDPFASVRHHFLDGDAQGLDRILRGDMATYLSDDIMVKVDRMTMANSLEARAPLLDHKLLEFSARLPQDMKLRGGTGKYLFKQVARELLPAEVLDKPKQGFAIPVAHWLRHELRERMTDTLTSSSFRQRGLFDSAGVERCMSRHRPAATTTANCSGCC
ncbi:asparagine synthase (glutamine-hydrolyzing) [Piscinibacter aquaticus]|uniref:asparagine synthase (glutamine-hydrolyzing) n=1 Tax=Piscinibacter aquaticus TaxID=392597 RepID=A0A5C6U052_9BURK|nr:asparagine synthase (glutamine-hydrolyzing) [Piscinibacter aquaticus]